MWNMSPIHTMWRLRTLTEEECPQPSQFGGGVGKYAHAARQGGFVTSDTVGLAGFEDEGGHAVETYIFSNGFVPPRLAKNGRKKGLWACTVEGAGGGALQKSGRVQTTLKSLLLQAILLTTWELLSGRGRLKGEII